MGGAGWEEEQSILLLQKLSSAMCHFKRLWRRSCTAVQNFLKCVVILLCGEALIYFIFDSTRSSIWNWAGKSPPFVRAQSWGLFIPVTESWRSRGLCSPGRSSLETSALLLGGRCCWAPSNNSLSEMQMNIALVAQNSRWQSRLWWIWLCWTEALVCASSVTG